MLQSDHQLGFYPPFHQQTRGGGQNENYGLFQERHCIQEFTGVGVGGETIQIQPPWKAIRKQGQETELWHEVHLDSNPHAATH